MRFRGPFSHWCQSDWVTTKKMIFKNKSMSIIIKRRVFYSFHYANDVRRVALIRNIGAIEGNKQATENEWEEVKKQGDRAIKKWIDENMENRTCLVVLVGEETANRKWVKYEIEHAWNTGMGVVGIYIHNINDPQTGKCKKGRNPFDLFTMGEDGENMSKIVKCYDPAPSDAYNDIRENLKDWIEEAIEIRKQY